MNHESASVYACYARDDRATVGPIIAALRARGVEVWDGGGAAHGDGGRAEDVRQAMERSRRMAIFVSAASLALAWVEDEILMFRWLMARDPGRGLIAVRLDGTSAPSLLTDAQELDARGVDADDVARLIAVEMGRAPADSSDIRSRTNQPPAGEPWVERGVNTGALAAAEEASSSPFGGDEPASRSVFPPAAPPPAPAPSLEPPGSAPAGAPPYAPPPEPGSPPPVFGGVESERSAPPQPVALERVAFAAYCPKEVEPRKATPLLVYLAVDEAGALAKVAALAAERLAGRLDQYRPGMADERMGLRRGAKLRLVPTIPGFHVNPQWMDVTWDEDAQQHEFSVRAESAPEGRAAEGAVRVYQGLTLRAEIPLSIFVARKAGATLTPDDFASAVARAYRRVFASYSHRDMPVVESCEAAARALGDRYLRDVMTLQSGQVWNEQLKAMINQADVFQLFWSKNAARSPFVREEWEYALALQANRPGFIRPVYWSSMPYAIPGELNPLHFEPLSLSALGWGAFRRMLYSLQAG